MLSVRSFLAPGVSLLLLLSLGLCTTGCSSPSQTSSDADDRVSQGPVPSLLYITPDAALVLHDTGADSSHVLTSDATSDGRPAVSSSGRYVAFRYTSADSAHLALLDRRDQTVQSVDVRPAAATHSLAWHSNEDRLAFGYYTPAASGTRGPGAIHVATPDGSTRNVGCTAAREVLHWLPDGALATRNDDRLYVVSPSDCATKASADARRMHQATYAPDGQRLAYIHRELTYDRDAADYTPDSSLYLSDQHGQRAEELLGSDRQVRHLTWAPDDSELAFDTHVQSSAQRQIATYNVGSERTVYLTPPEQTGADQVHPRWSPSGNHLAFVRRTETGRTAAVRVDGQTRQLGPVTGPVTWLDEKTLVLRGPDSLRIRSLAGEDHYTEPAPATLIDVWIRNPA